VRCSDAYDLIFASIKDVGHGPKIVILDACRTNPFATQSPNDWVPGLAAPVNAPGNTLIAFSTDPGNVAADGIGVHSPYTRALLRYLQQPGLDLNEIFRRTRDDVESNSDSL
jgi:uncharacterized caspase-like protein